MAVDAQQSAQAEIEGLFRRWADLEVTGDLEAWLEFVADDAVLQPPGEPPVEGKAAVREYAAALFKLPIVRMEPGSLQIHVSASGDLACNYGPLKMALEDENGRVEYELKCMAIWKKDSGRWKITANSWHECSIRRLMRYRRDSGHAGRPKAPKLQQGFGPLRAIASTAPHNKPMKLAAPFF